MFCTSLLLLCAQSTQLEFVDYPVDGQLYPRNADSIAEVRFSGWVPQASWQYILVFAERDHHPFALKVQQLSYSAGRADFDLKVPIRAELHSYSFKVALMGSSQVRLVGTAEDVVAGDAFLMEGQSNTVAWDAYGEGLANLEQSPWIRSFGTSSASPTESRDDKNWYMADGETALDKGSIGAWGLHMARLIVDEIQVPVAIINGAVGATAIKYHMRNDSNPATVYNMYGRLLNRAQNAGIADSVRAILWHQGESDGPLAENYARKFTHLHSDWLEDYPSLEQIYMFQVREGCGQPSIDLRNVQRRLKDYLPLLQVMSTTAAPSHDGCHFYYAGYKEFGDRIARLIARDLYGSGNTQNIDAPDIQTVAFTSILHDSILLTFRDPDDALHFDPGAIHDFELEDGVTVQSGTVSGNTILLGLSGPTTSRTLAYLGHKFDGAWITNARGIGALTFKVPIKL
jgi:carbohydrate esterase-like sialic acid-specific acetylesterase